MNGGNDWREWGNGSEGFAANTWYHIVYTKKNSIEYAYVNTVLVNQWLVNHETYQPTTQTLKLDIQRMQFLDS